MDTKTKNMGWEKYTAIDKVYHRKTDVMLNLDIPKIDFVHQFPIFVGHVNLGRYLSIYDLYKRCNHLNGHIAEVGTWKGAFLLFMAKLIRLFESYATTQVHGFDWFKGMGPSKVQKKFKRKEYLSEYKMLLRLIKLQDLEDTAIIHKMNVQKELSGFFKKNPSLRFKMVFIDCGHAPVIDVSMQNFWPRLNYGGFLIMDHYNVELSPDESNIVDKYIGKNQICHFPFNRQPTAFIQKIH